jgi:hypothetical protein
MNRVVAAEWLDELPPHDPRAIWSRRDLRRLNSWMGNRPRIEDTLRNVFASRPPRRLAELGAGDGTFLLRLARRLGARWPNVEVSLVDRQPAISPEVLQGIRECGWNAEVITADVFDWLKAERRFDCLMANLFLHHFDLDALARLLELAAATAPAFVACEPRRSTTGLVTGRLLWLIGCNSVTRHDAPISVRAGFCGTELSSIWPGGDWQLEERKAGLFSHLFVARKDTA